MNDKEDFVMDENVQNQDSVENQENPEDTESDKGEKESGGDPWGCGTIVVMFIVGLCVNMCSVLREIGNGSYYYTPHHYDYSSDWSDRSAAFHKRTLQTMIPL